MLVLGVASQAAAAGWCLDPRFGDGGLVLLDVGGVDNVHWAAQGLSVLPNGNLVIGGSLDGGFFAARLDGNGQLDPGFGVGGLAIATFPGATQVELNALAVFPDGTVALGGESRGTSNQTRITLARLTSTGALDSIFGGGTLVPTFLPEPELVNGLVALSDGRLVISGQGRTRGSDFNVFVAALARDGGLDVTFGNVGVTDLDFGGREEFGGAIVQDVQQRLLVPMVTQTPSGDDFGLARLVSSGLFDGTFSPAPLVGRLRFDLTGGDEECTAVTTQVDGKIVAGGDLTFRDGGGGGAVLRLASNGARDSTFGDGGTLVPSGFTSVRSVLALDDGTLVIGGTMGAGASSDLGVLFLDSEGRPLDAGFVNPFRLDVAGGLDGLRTLRDDRLGRVVAFGAATRGAQNDVVVLRLVDCALADAGVPVDAGADAGVDAGLRDAGASDAGRDSGTADGGGFVDAGADAGLGTPRTFGVGCGCSTAPLGLVIGGVLLMVARRRARAR